MASFGWKRKIGEKVSKVTSQQFEAEAADEKDAVENDEGNWLQAVKRRKEILLEGCAEKSKQLKDEGANLAENKRAPSYHFQSELICHKLFVLVCNKLEFLKTCLFFCVSK
uniref:Tetratricopeptide repeat domain 33 n=1 Tax=Sus scrofa TaxID=9823 RepID=A0A8D1MP45_PIG